MKRNFKLGRKVLLAATSFVLVTTILASCSSKGTVSFGELIYSKDPIELTAEQKEMIGSHIDDMTLICSDGGLNLYVNMLTAEFAIENTADNSRWLSNPVDWDQDTVAGTTAKSILGSQVVVNYSDGKGTSFSLNSYSDSFLKGQTSVQKIDGGVRVEYLIGVNQTIQYCPEIIRYDEFQKILSQLPADEAKTLKRRYREVDVKALTGDNLKTFLENYPKIQDFDKVYVIRDLNATIKKEIGQQIEPFEWNSAKIAQEHALFGYEKKTEDTGCFYVPAEYRLENGSFVAELKTEEIQCAKGFYIDSIDFLPYFAATDEKESGYMFIPDGSGALIELNSSVKNGYAYSQPVYGEDFAVTQTVRDQISQQIFMPVFGLSSTQGGFLAIIEGAETVASVNANIGSVISSYNTVWASFAVQSSDYLSYENLMNEDGVNVYSSATVKAPCSIRYFFLEKEENSYVDMAGIYRNYLLENGKISPKKSDATAPFYLELIGSVRKRKTLLVVPYQTQIALTTFDQAQTIIDQLIQREVRNIKLRYTGWANGGLNNSVYSSAKPVSSLGGKNNLQELIGFAEEKNIPVYMDAEIMFVYEDKLLDGFNRKQDASRLITKKLATRQDALKSTGKLLDTNIADVVSARVYEKILSAFLKEYEQLGSQNISLASLGSCLSGDYRQEDGINRSDAARIIESLMADKISGKYTLMTDGANAYMFSYASDILNAPDDSSRFLISSGSVPFYQIVLSGSISYAAQPLNLTGDWKSSILRAAETGAGLYCKWMYAENSELYDTTQTDLFALNYSTWIDDVSSQVKAYQESMAGIAGQTIVNHVKISDKVYKTEFENGAIVYVNYGENDITTEGRTIKASSYFTVRGDESLCRE